MQPSFTVTSDSLSLSIDNDDKKYPLSDLLPYELYTKFGERLEAGLKEYDFLLASLEEVIKAARSDDLEKFDPLVGENACQIRALKNCIIFSKSTVIREDLSHNIALAKIAIKNILKSITSSDSKDIQSLEDILNKPVLRITLNYRELYLMLCYLLTVVKIIKKPKKDFQFIKNEVTDYKKLKLIRPVGTMFAEKLIKKLRETLSNLSVQFIQEIAFLYAPESVVDEVTGRLLVKHRYLHCLPCYWVTKLLMIHAEKTNVPLTIITRQLGMDRDYQMLREDIFHFSSDKFGYQQTPITHLNPVAPSLVFLVNACRPSYSFPDSQTWRDQLGGYSPTDLVLAYAAAHRQYPNPSLDDLVDEDKNKEYAFYKQKAEDWGCSIEKPFTFFLSHAYCEKVYLTANQLAATSMGSS